MFEVDEVRALGDLLVIGLAGLRLGLSRVRSLTGGLCGIGGHNDSPVSRPIRWVQAASLLYRGQHTFRSRQRPSTHVDAGRLGGDRDLLTRRGVATRVRLAHRLDPDRQLDKAADAVIRADDRPRPGRAIASATFRVLAKDDLDVDAALASALGCLPTDEVAAAAPATALSPEGPCCTRLRRCPDCPEGATRAALSVIAETAASRR